MLGSDATSSRARAMFSPASATESASWVSVEWIVDVSFDVV